MYREIPDLLSQEFAMQILGDQFREDVFNELKNENDLVPKAEFMAALRRITLEEDTKALFLKFAPSGDMDTKAFLTLCRDSKTLDGKSASFTTADADVIFNLAKTKEGSDEFITVDTFLSFVVPQIATKKGDFIAIKTPFLYN